MFNSLSIKWKVSFIPLIAVIFTAIVASIISIKNINDISNNDIKIYEKRILNSKKDELKTAIEIAKKTIESYYKRTAQDKIEKEVQTKLKNQLDVLLNSINYFYETNKDKLTRIELETQIKILVKGALYNNNIGYFWINDTQPKMIMHPFKPKLDGKDLSKFKDPKGTYLFNEMVKVCQTKNGRGFVKYYWPKPNFDKPQLKISYVAIFKPFNWIIGTGEYVDDITKKIQEEALLTIANMRFGKNNQGYFWINDSQPKMVMHPMKPQLNGKDLSQSKDPNGVYLFNEMVKVIQTNGEGFVRYSWSKPNKLKPQPKISYVTHFKEWDWIIGTGTYIDDIKDEVAIIQKITDDKINNIFMNFIIIIIIVIIKFINILLILSLVIS